MNTNKRSVVLDLDTPQGQAMFRRLAQSAGIVVESCPPGYHRRNAASAYADIAGKARTGSGVDDDHAVRLGRAAAPTGSPTI